MKKFLIGSAAMIQTVAFGQAVDCYSPSAVVDGGYHVTAVDRPNQSVMVTVRSAGIDNTLFAQIEPVAVTLLKRNPPIVKYQYTSKNISFQMSVDLQKTPAGNFAGDFVLNTPDGSFDDELNCTLIQ